MTHLNNASTDMLFSAILNLNTKDECLAFFQDICTIKELSDMSQRLMVAKMLSEGKIYQDISKETGASTTTISRVSRCLNYGSGGYRSALSKEENR